MVYLSIREEGGVVEVSEAVHVTSWATSEESVSSREMLAGFSDAMEELRAVCKGE